MYYYEKDYLMRLIHNISHALAYLSFGKKGETLPEVMGQEVRADNDYLLRMIDSGQINAAENRLFELIESGAWDPRQKTALILSFYDCLNGKKDDYLEASGFCRDEIRQGLYDALRMTGIRLPEYPDGWDAFAYAETVSMPLSPDTDPDEADGNSTRKPLGA
jgi:hypothetical protein